MDNNQSVIPSPEPGWNSARTLNGGYTVHPAIAGPVSINNEEAINTLDRKKSQ